MERNTVPRERNQKPAVFERQQAFFDFMVLLLDF